MAKETKMARDEASEQISFLKQQAQAVEDAKRMRLEGKWPEAKRKRVEGSRPRDPVTGERGEPIEYVGDKQPLPKEYEQLTDAQRAMLPDTWIQSELGEPDSPWAGPTIVSGTKGGETVEEMRQKYIEAEEKHAAHTPLPYHGREETQEASHAANTALTQALKDADADGWIGDGGHAHQAFWGLVKSGAISINDPKLNSLITEAGKLRDVDDEQRDKDDRIARAKDFGEDRRRLLEEEFPERIKRLKDKARKEDAAAKK